MPRRIALDAFEDAERHLVQSITCPDSIEGRRRHISSLRIAIVLAWVAAEQETKNQLREFASFPGAPAPPEDLYGQIVYCLAARQALKSATAEVEQAAPGTALASMAALPRAEEEIVSTLARERAFQPHRWQQAFFESTQLYPTSEFGTYRGMREELTQTSERKAAACVAYCRGLMIELAGEPMGIFRSSPLARHLWQ